MLPKEILLLEKLTKPIKVNTNRDININPKKIDKE